MHTDISNSDDVIDSRQIIERIDELDTELREAHEAIGTDTQYATWLQETREDSEHTLQDAAIELHALTSLQDDAQGYSEDWKHGTTLIRDSYFTEYAQELAEDIGAVKDDDGWPGRHIDWDAAADELKQDYTEVEFDGVAYWVC